ncbi:MAG: acyl-CoA thioesterase [Lentisphaeria bacterium]|nr:acyl-CoA thioesterase [Lentisphaeria bacterium]
MSAVRSHVCYRVPYADTDQMGVVYYAQYLVYFERARTELLRQLGFPYRELEAKGFALPVVDAHVSYRGAARYDDELDLSGWLSWARPVRIRVDCEVACAGDVLVRGYTEHACVSLATRKPVRMPPELACIFQTALADASP